MKKSLLTGLLQYIGAVVLVICSALTVYAFDAGKLPFMDEDYLEARKQASGGAALPEDNNAGDKEAVQQTVTAATFTSSLPKADKNTVPFNGVYAGGNYGLALRPVSDIGNLGDAQLELRCGFIIKSENGKVVSVYDSMLNDVSSVVDGWSLTYLRNAEGKLIFTKDGKHAYVEDGQLVPCDYDSINLDKGVYSEYPPSFFGYDTDYTVFQEGELYGMKKADGTVITSPEYIDVYGVSEGYFVAVDSEKKLHLFREDGTLISDEYFSAEKDDESAIGYYFVKNGITRARTADGKEVLLRTDGTLITIPSGFAVCAYSDGAILLKGASGYGYMNSNGRWISTPDYKNAFPFSEGLAVVCDGEGNYGMIDLLGNTVVPHVFTSIDGCFDGVILAYADKYGYYIINKVQISA